MIETLKTREGYLKAFCDYRLVDEYGKNNKKGDRLYIKELWVHPRHRRKKLMNKIFTRIHSKFNTICFVYWLRDKYSDRMSFYPFEKLKERRFA